MSLPKCNVNTDVISNLPDAPALTAADLKAKFDEAGDNLKKYINNTQNPEIESLISQTKTTIQNNVAQQLDETIGYTVVDEF